MPRSERFPLFSSDFSPTTLDHWEEEKDADQAGGVQKRKRKRRSSGQQQNLEKKLVINALLRGRVQLDCNLTPTDPDDSVSLVLWYKDNSMVPIYR